MLAVVKDQNAHQVGTVPLDWVLLSGSRGEKIAFATQCGVSVIKTQNFHRSDGTLEMREMISLGDAMNINERLLAEGDVELRGYRTHLQSMLPTLDPDTLDTMWEFLSLPMFDFCSN